MCLMTSWPGSMPLLAAIRVEVCWRMMRRYGVREIRGYPREAVMVSLRPYLDGKREAGVVKDAEEEQA